MTDLCRFDLEVLRTAQACYHRATSMRTRGDFSVVALALLTSGNSLATFWAGALPAGVVLTAAAAVCIGVAIHTAPGAPSPHVIGGAVAISALSLIDHPLAPIAAVAVLVLAITGVLARRLRLGVALVVTATAVVVGAEVNRLQWGQLAFDVFREMQVATGALAHLVDPYGPTVQVMIPVSDHGAYLAPEHFGYGPGILLLGLPGRLVGDVRLSQAAIWIAVAVVIASVARRQPISVAVGSTALVLLSPFGVDLAEHAFNDATGALCLLLWFLGRQRHHLWARLALGVALTTKPTMLAALLVMLVWSRAARRDIWWALVIAAAIILPFALWDGVGNFLHATIELWLGPIFLVNRADAITIGALLHTYGLPYLPSAVIGTATLLVGLWVLRHRPRDSVDLLLGGSVLTIAYLVLGHIAFLNYYSTAAVFLMAAIAIDGNCRFDAAEDVSLPRGRHTVRRVPGSNHRRLSLDWRRQREAVCEGEVGNRGGSRRADGSGSVRPGSRASTSGAVQGAAEVVSTDGSADGGSVATTAAAVRSASSAAAISSAGDDVTVSRAGSLARRSKR